jgi:hypothetical protein
MTATLTFQECMIAKPVFELLIAGEKLIITTPDAPHDFPPEARNEAYLFLDSELGVNNK